MQVRLVTVLMTFVSCIGSVLCWRTTECGDSSCDIEEQFTKPDKIRDGRFQAVIGESVSLGCLAKDYSNLGAWHVCIRDLLHPSAQRTNCSYASRNYCRHECPVELWFKNIQPSQASTYCCNGTMMESPTTDGVCVDLVVGEKKSLSFRHIPNSHVNVSEGDTLVLMCKGSGYPEPRYKWLHNGAVIKNESVDGTLKVDEVTTSDGGWYQCVMNNRFETRQTQKISVDIKMKSVFIKYKYVFVGVCSGFVVVVLVLIFAACMLRKHGGNVRNYAIIDDRVNTPPLIGGSVDGGSHSTLSDSREIEDERICYDEPYFDDNNMEPPVVTYGLEGSSNVSSENPVGMDASGSVEDNYCGGMGSSEENGCTQIPTGSSVNILNVPAGTVIHTHGTAVISFGDHNVINVVDQVQQQGGPNSASADNERSLSSSEDFQIDSQKCSPAESEETFVMKSGDNTNCKTVAEERHREIHKGLSQEVSLLGEQSLSGSRELRDEEHPSCSPGNMQGSPEESNVLDGSACPNSATCDCREGAEDNCHTACNSCHVSTPAFNSNSGQDSDNNVWRIDTQKLGNYEVVSHKVL